MKYFQSIPYILSNNISFYQQFVRRGRGRKNQFPRQRMRYTRFEDFSKHDLAIRCKTFRFTDAIPQFLDHFEFNEMKATRRRPSEEREGRGNIRRLRRVIFKIEKCWRSGWKKREEKERARERERESKNGRGMEEWLKLIRKNLN